MDNTNLKLMVDEAYGIEDATIARKATPTIDKFEEVNKKIDTNKKEIDTTLHSHGADIEALRANKMDNVVTIYWKTLSDKAKVPSKRAEDAGLDLYTIEDGVVIPPHGIHSFKTGLASIFSKNFWVEFKERGSTGSIGLATRSGVVDSGYRGEWMVTINNTNNFPIEISSAVSKVTYVYGKVFKKKIKKIIYPASKAIAQAVLIPLPRVISTSWKEADDSMKASERGVSGWGASGK